MKSPENYIKVSKLPYSVVSMEDGSYTPTPRCTIREYDRNDNLVNTEDCGNVDLL